LPDKVDCLGLGIAPADILMRLARYPKPGAKVDAIETVIQGGGPIPTALVTVARLGFKSTLIAKVGNDIFGDFVVKELHDEGVDTSCIIRSDKLTAIACGWVEKQTGRRTIALELQVKVKPSDIVLHRLPRPKIIHLDARDLSACMKLARWGNRNGITVMLDVGSIRNDVSKILPLVDHFVCAGDLALPYTGTGSIPKALAKLQKICQGTVVITSGLKGSNGVEKDGAIVHQKAFKVKTIDTTGAGDAYHGAYIAGLLKGWNLKERLRFASAVAAIKCTKMGGRTAIPTMRQVLAFLNKRGV
jgi:sulfofructose kinase